MLRGFWVFLEKIWSYRGVILALSRRQLTVRYIGTVGGPIWTVVQPLATITVFWVVFSLGFRAQGPNNTPFLLYFLPGYIVWLLFSEIVTTSTASIVGNAYLVKKTVFPVQVLPIVQIVSASVPHFLMIFVTLLFVLFYGGSLPAIFPAVLYFYAAVVGFALGLGWLAAAFNVFYRDVEQIITVMLNLWFWATPIAWPVSILPEKLTRLLVFNPMFFIVEGYRTSLAGISTESFDLTSTMFFWSATAISLIVGAQVFRRLKPDFPEML